jgi:hypothetical protein
VAGAFFPGEVAAAARLIVNGAKSEMSNEYERMRQVKRRLKAAGVQAEERDMAR